MVSIFNTVNSVDIVQNFQFVNNVNIAASKVTFFVGFYCLSMQYISGCLGEWIEVNTTTTTTTTATTNTATTNTWTTTTTLGWF